jgi:CRP-like cAMP-binding protein
MMLAQCIAGAGRAGEDASRALAHARAVLEGFGYGCYLDYLSILEAWHGSSCSGDPAPLVRCLSTLDHETEPSLLAFGAVRLARIAALEHGITDELSRRLRAWSTAGEGISALVSACWEEVEAILDRDTDALVASIERWRDGGRAHDAAAASLVLATMLVEDGATDTAEQHARRALREFVAGGAHADSDRARRLLERIGLTPTDAPGLLGCEAFAALPAGTVVRLVHDARRIELDATGTLDASELEDGIVIIGSGTALVVAGEEEQAPVMGVRFAGDCHVGAWYRSRGGDVTTSLVAATAVVAWCVPGATVRAACADEPRLVGVLLALADEHRSAERAVAIDLASVDVQARLARTLLRLADRRGRPSLQGHLLVDAVFTAEQLARMCGTQRQRVSTMLAAWKRDGIVDTWKRRLVIRDIELLRAIAGQASESSSASSDSRV